MIKQDANHRNMRTAGAEKLQPSHERKDTASFPDTGDAGDRPREPYGLTESGDNTSESTRTSEGVNPSGAEPPEEAFFDEDLQRSRTL